MPAFKSSFRAALLVSALAIVSLPATAQFVPTSVSAGGQHSCAVTTDGGVKCWGYNSNGQLGNGSSGTLEYSPVNVSGLAGAVAVTTGDSHSCALTNGGAVKCWGRNDQGQLGDGSGGFFGSDKLVPVDVAGLASGVAAIAAGATHTCALTTAGGVKCWGANNNGQLGSAGGSQPTPVDVTGLASGMTAIAAGVGHTCALAANGGMKCWGRNSDGQLGDNSIIQRPAPVDVTGLASGVAAIATGNFHTCAVTSGGAAKCWGNNGSGKLGDGSISTRRVPVDVVGLASGVATIAPGANHTCALTTGGAVQCWGDNGSLQLGIGLDFGNHYTPGAVPALAGGIVAISAGTFHSCAIATEGEMKCWGNSAQLGDGGIGPFTAVVRVTGQAMGNAKIASNYGHNCVLTNGGGVKCWGQNLSGQLGDGTTTSPRSTPVDVLGLSSGITAIATGETHGCALTVDGGVKCWGSNFVGQLGDGFSFNDRPTPDFVDGLESGVTAIAAGQAHTCALTTSGGVKCWGFNNSGQLGDGGTTNRFTQMDVPGLTTGVAAIAAATQYTCALTTGGGVKCWGSNGIGQLGDNSNTERHTPVDVFGLTSGVSAISAVGSHTCALTTTGGVKCWGYNVAGQLGDLTTANRNAPTNVLGLASGVLAIATGAYQTCALVTGGGMKCWGGNFAGAMGNGTFGNDPVSVGYVSGLTSGVAAISTGGMHSCALMTRGGAKCWGMNQHGEVGDATTLNKYVPTEVSGLKSAQSISFSAPPSVNVGASTNLIAFASSTLPVTFDTWTPAICAVTGNSLTVLAAGLCGVRASQAGNGGNFAAPQQLRFVATTESFLTPPNDFNDDGKSDLLWKNTADGTVQGWVMDGLTASQIAGLLPPGGYSVTHVADLDGDGKADLLIRHTDGTVIGWLMNGLGVSSNATLLAAGSGWSVMKTGDFNGDGKADLIVQHTDGRVVAWIMNGFNVVSSVTFVPAGSGWSVAKVADLNGDGKSDLLWQHTDGTVQAWLMDGTTATQVATFVGAGSGWSVARTGDFDGDGKSDLLWQHADGRSQVWIMNGLAVTGLATFTPAGTGWTPVHAGDIDGDGKDDIFWEHTSGASQTWLMNGTSVTGLATYVPAGTGWTASHLFDLNGDGKKDVLWKHTSGAVQAWLMNGLTITQLATLAAAGTYQITPPAP